MRTCADELHNHHSGEWSLWCDQILWRIEQGGRVLAGSEDDRPTMEAAISQMNGHTLLSGEICRDTGNTALRFSDGLVLRTFVITSDEDARWNFRHCDSDVVLLGPVFPNDSAYDALPKGENG